MLHKFKPHLTILCHTEWHYHTVQFAGHPDKQFRNSSDNSEIIQELFILAIINPIIGPWIPPMAWEQCVNYIISNEHKLNHKIASVHSSIRSVGTKQTITDTIQPAATTKGKCSSWQQVAIGPHATQCGESMWCQPGGQGRKKGAGWLSHLPWRWIL